MNVPEHLFYTKDHEWVLIENNLATIGITDFAQSELGDIIFIEMPEIGIKAANGDTIGTIEAVKTVADIYAPLSGIISEINTAVEDNPENVNKDPYHTGWIAKITLESTNIANLLSAVQYKEFIN